MFKIDICMLDAVGILVFQQYLSYVMGVKTTFSLLVVVVYLFA